MKHYYPPKQENLPGTGIDGEFGDVEFAAIEEAREDSLELIDLSEDLKINALIKDHVSRCIKDIMCGDIVCGIACDVADAKLNEDYPNMEHLVEVKEGNWPMSTAYTEESQVLFDKIYDEVFPKVESYLQKVISSLEGIEANDD